MTLAVLDALLHAILGVGVVVGGTRTVTSLLIILVIATALRTCATLLEAALARLIASLIALGVVETRTIACLLAWLIACLVALGVVEARTITCLLAWLIACLVALGIVEARTIACLLARLIARVIIVLQQSRPETFRPESALIAAAAPCSVGALHADARTLRTSAATIILLIVCGRVLLTLVFLL